MAHYGKYRGSVIDNVDPQQRGRVQVQVPDLPGDALQAAWAEPCLPPGYWSVPAVGAEVWIEFERGDPALPIWVGVRMATRDPAWPEAVQLRTRAGFHLEADASRVALSNGYGAHVELAGPTVRVNGGALDVT